MRICLVASSRFPVREPFAGGLEAHTSMLAQALVQRGHEVSLFAAAGSDAVADFRPLDVDAFVPSPTARADVGAMPDEWMREHHAYLALMLGLAGSDAGRFDVVHNNSLHHLPIAMAGMIDIPVVTTLHTPPTGWLESAVRFAPPSARFIAVSRHTANAWRHAVPSVVIPNGVDTDRWVPGPGGDRAVWFGRLVPEKAPHLAIEAATRARIPLDLAGPVLDRAYFAAEIAPRLSDTVRYVGHLDQAGLTELIGHACVTIVSPVWDEPYGLVAAESLACGTPVAAFARGALPEIVDASSGRLARGGDVDALAHAVTAARRLSRAAARHRAVAQCSLDTMVDAYERVYADLSEATAA